MQQELLVKDMLEDLVLVEHRRITVAEAVEPEVPVEMQHHVSEGLAEHPLLLVPVFSMQLEEIHHGELQLLVMLQV